MRNNLRIWFSELTRLYLKVWLAFIIVWVPQLVSSQILLEPQILHANLLGQEHGLLQLNVKSMAQDKLGFLWVGTEDGLHRFNGYEFKPYLHDPNDSTSISDDHIRGLLFRNDKLWMASNTNGISWYEPSKNRFFDLYTDQENIDLNTSY